MKYFLHATSVASVRFLLAAWVGAAVLFVITSVAEQTSVNFDSVTRDQLATVRFPLYYRFGFACLIAAFFANVIAVATAASAVRSKWLVVGGLVAVAGGLMIADFQWIYQPLQDLITPAGQARTPEFESLHTWSRYANQTHVGIIMFAGIVSCLTLQDKTARKPQSESDSIAASQP
ncbi:MAG: hypothetical protein ABJZ55_02150 [Fuerstiella sp.]